MNNERNSGENRKPMSEKRRVKKQINHVMRGIFLYNVIILFVVVADMIIKTVGVILEYPGGPGQDAAIDALLAKLLNSGSSSIVAVLIGTAFLLLYFRKDRLLEPMLAPGKRPSAGRFMQFVCPFGNTGKYPFSDTAHSTSSSVIAEAIINSRRACGTRSSGST